MLKRWNIPPALTPDAGEHLKTFHPVLRQVLFNRGLDTEQAARSFLLGQSTANTDPGLLTGITAAVDRIDFALKKNRKIAVYGDYDVDGVTATALLVQALEHAGGEVQPYIPNRFDEGYGLNTEALDSLVRAGADLVITVDCGIRSPAEADHARAIGLDLIITDHHHPAEGDLPVATAIINPKLPGDSYPEKYLAGVGIAYKLAQAVARAPEDDPRLQTALDLVALGTVADLAPLVGENRNLVRTGIEALRRTKRLGLLALAHVAGIRIAKTTAGQIGFILGPRLNAAGRLQSAEAALELLLTADTIRAGSLAQELNVNNQERQVATREIQQKAESMAAAEGAESWLLFAAHESFNAGVVGLAASRLSEAYYRPAIVAAIGPEETRGSCRSIPEFHITEALDRCADLLIRHGGHAAAAGFTAKNEQVPDLVRRLQEIARSELSGQDLRPTVNADMELPLGELSFELLGELQQMEPTGYGNREAVFISRDVKVRSSRAVGAEGRHLKLTIQDERGITTDVIGFRMGEKLAELPARVDLAYTLEANEYNGRTSLQLNLRDLKPAGSVD